MFWDTNVSPPPGRGVLAFVVLLGNSLAGKNELGSQTHYPTRPRELRISQSAIPSGSCAEAWVCSVATRQERLWVTCRRVLWKPCIYIFKSETSPKT